MRSRDILARIVLESEQHKELWEDDHRVILDSFHVEQDEGVIFYLGKQGDRFGYFIGGNYYFQPCKLVSAYQLLKVIKRHSTEGFVRNNVLSLANSFVDFLKSVSESGYLDVNEVKRIQKELGLKT